MADLRDNASTWMYSTHAVVLGGTFSTFAKAAAATAQASIGNNERDNLSAEYKAVVDHLPQHMRKVSYVDTSVGGSEVFNPYWSFNEDDDIVMPMDETGGPGSSRGLGLAYKEMYYYTQQVVHITCGVAEYNNVAKFILNSTDSDLEDVMSGGIMKSLVNLFYETGKLAISIPWLPLIWTYHLMQWSYKPEAIATYQFYTFRSAMNLYIRMVNTMMIQIATGLGIYENPQIKPGDLVKQGFFKKSYQYLKSLYTGEPTRTQKSKLEQILNNQYKNSANDGRAALTENKTATLDQYMNSNSLLPELMRNGGPDLYRWLNKRRYRVNPRQNKLSPEELDKAYNRKEEDRHGDKKDTKDGWSNTLGIMWSTAQGASDYIGFRMEKSTDSSESISNSIGESQLAGKLNSIISGKRSRDFTFSMGKSRILTSMKTGLNTLGDVGKLLHGDVISIATGSSYSVIPDEWKNSSFSRSYNLSVKLRARYADPISIFQSIYIPLCMWLGMVIPKEAGATSYTSPFLIRAYSKGMFMIPMGMVESMQITRGADEFGWSFNSLPTSVDLSITIRDLNPALFVGLNQTTTFFRNDNMDEYLTTLSGIGLAERMYLFPRMRRKWQAFKQTVYRNRLSPLAIGNNLGATSFGKMVGAVTPGLVSNN